MVCYIKSELSTEVVDRSATIYILISTHRFRSSVRTKTNSSPLVCAITVTSMYVCDALQGLEFCSRLSAPVVNSFSSGTGRLVMHPVV